MHPRAEIRVGASQSPRLGLWKPWDLDTWPPTRGRSSQVWIQTLRAQEKTRASTRGALRPGRPGGPGSHLPADRDRYHCAPHSPPGGVGVRDHMAARPTLDHGCPRDTWQELPNVGALTWRAGVRVPSTSNRQRMRSFLRAPSTATAMAAAPRAKRCRRCSSSRGRARQRSGGAGAGPVCGTGRSSGHRSSLEGAARAAESGLYWHLGWRGVVMGGIRALGRQRQEPVGKGVEPESSVGPGLDFSWLRVIAGHALRGWRWGEGGAQSPAARVSVPKVCRAKGEEISGKTWCTGLPVIQHLGGCLHRHCPAIILSYIFCLFVRGQMHETAHVWRSEGNSQEPLLFLHHCRSRKSQVPLPIEPSQRIRHTKCI